MTVKELIKIGLGRVIWTDEMRDLVKSFRFTELEGDSDFLTYDYDYKDFEQVRTRILVWLPIAKNVEAVIEAPLGIFEIFGYFFKDNTKYTVYFTPLVAREVVFGYGYDQITYILEYEGEQIRFSKENGIIEP